MEQYIQISKINDFIFCPYSIYYHSVYEEFDQKSYHQTPQLAGKIKHEAIDQDKYSSSKRYIVNLPVYSVKYCLAGKIDIYDTEQQALIERKNLVSRIYDGQRYQLYAQMICLQELGYEIKKLFIHSMSDNKRLEVDLPNAEELNKFFSTLRSIQNFEPAFEVVTINDNKCANCIYCNLCVQKNI